MRVKEGVTSEGRPEAKYSLVRVAPSIHGTRIDLLFPRHRHVVLPMEIAFESKQLREICERESKAKREFGNKVAEGLKRRLADLRAADSMADVAAGNAREVTADAGPVMVIDLCDGYAIIFHANHLKNPLNDSGAVDWSCVSRIKVLRVEKSHA